jgi:hypothetical protein
VTSKKKQWLTRQHGVEVHEVEEAEVHGVEEAEVHEVEEVEQVQEKVI